MGLHCSASLLESGRPSQITMGKDLVGRRITFLVISLYPGGAETQLVRVARALQRRGWDVRIVSLLPAEGLVAEVEAAGIPFTSLEMRRDGWPGPGPAFRLHAILRRERPDLLVTFMFHANVLGRIVGRAAGVPVIVSSVRTDNFGGPARYRLVALTDRLADVTTTNSRFVAADLVRRGVVAEERMRVIPNGIDTARPRPPEAVLHTIRGEMGLAPGRFAWLTTGHLQPRKDYPTLLRALQRLGERAERWEIRIVGEGPLEAELRVLAAELALDERTRFCGFRQDAAVLPHLADGFVMSSAAEGTPNALMEAMLTGTPAVGTAVGGIPELIEDGVTGFLVAPGDPDALAEAMHRMMNLSPDAVARMGESARVRVVATHDLEGVVDRWEELFRQLLARERVKE